MAIHAEPWQIPEPPPDNRPQVGVWNGENYTYFTDAYDGDDAPRWSPIQRAVVVARLRALADLLDAQDRGA